MLIPFNKLYNFPEWIEEFRMRVFLILNVRCILTNYKALTIKQLHVSKQIVS